MGLFNKMKEPVFLKENSDAEAQLEKLKILEQVLSAEGQAIIRQDIKRLEYGIAGEKNIAYELKNSHMAMYILHDIYLEDGDLSAQIDYLVFTRKICFVIECKNLYGDVEITNRGDFIRTVEFGGRKKKEGIYSPITQNQRHLELMKKIKTDRNNNFLIKLMVGKYFEDFNKSVVVLANPKTILNARYSKKEIKDKVIRGDQLVSYIKDMYNKSKESVKSDEQLLKWAQSYLNLHIFVEKDYTEKYNQYKIENVAMAEKIGVELLEKYKAEQTDVFEETGIFKELKAYRLEKSREEKIKPYFIYSDKQLKDIIDKMPKTNAEIMQVAGFGETKANKYGNDILKIAAKYQDNQETK